MHDWSPCRVVDGVAAEEVPEGAEEVVAQEREARPVRQHEHSGKVIDLFVNTSLRPITIDHFDQPDVEIRSLTDLSREATVFL